MLDSLAVIPKNETMLLRGCVPIVVKDPCTRIMHPYRAFNRVKTGSCILYPGVSGYRKYVVFSTPFHKLVAGAINL